MNDLMQLARKCLETPAEDEAGIEVRDRFDERVAEAFAADPGFVSQKRVSVEERRGAVRAAVEASKDDESLVAELAKRLAKRIPISTSWPLSTDPPPIEWLVKGTIPAGEVGFVTGLGGWREDEAVPATRGGGRDGNPGVAALREPAGRGYRRRGHAGQRRLRVVGGPLRGGVEAGFIA